MKLKTLEDLQLERWSDDELVDINGDTWILRHKYCVIDPETMTGDDGFDYVCLGKLGYRDKTVITFEPTEEGWAEDMDGEMWAQRYIAEGLDEELRETKYKLETLLSLLDTFELRETIAKLDYHTRVRVERAMGWRFS